VFLAHGCESHVAELKSEMGMGEYALHTSNEKPKYSGHTQEEANFDGSGVEDGW
jgi:hypothetical protein